MLSVEHDDHFPIREKGRNMRLVILLIIAAVVPPAVSVYGQQVPAKRPNKIWNRSGPLGETPKYVTDVCPLSDQNNKGGWVKFEPMSDEFEGEMCSRSAARPRGSSTSTT